VQPVSGLHGALLPQDLRPLLEAGRDGVTLRRQGLQESILRISVSAEKLSRHVFMQEQHTDFDLEIKD
jgi:hypothetical protein